MPELQESSASEGDSPIGENSPTTGGAWDGVNFVPAVATGTNSNADVASTDHDTRFDQLCTRIESLSEYIDNLTATVVVVSDTIRIISPLSMGH